MGVSQLALVFPHLRHHPFPCAWRSLNKSTCASCQLQAGLRLCDSSFGCWSFSETLWFGTNDLCDRLRGWHIQIAEETGPRLQDHK